MLSNHALADEALNASNQICDGDPLLVNERGVMAFNHGEFVQFLIPDYRILMCLSFSDTSELPFFFKNRSTLRRSHKVRKSRGRQRISIWEHASAS
jgi:hypothetical protein